MWIAYHCHCKFRTFQKSISLFLYYIEINQVIWDSKMNLLYRILILHTLLKETITTAIIIKQSFYSSLQIALTRRSTLSSTPPPSCCLEVSDYGIRMIDKSKTVVSRYWPYLFLCFIWRLVCHYYYYHVTPWEFFSLCWSFTGVWMTASFQDSSQYSGWVF